LVNAPGHLLTF